MIAVGEKIEGLNLRELSKVQCKPFQVKLIVYIVAVIVLGALSLLLTTPLWLLPSILLGLAYAHAVELQHQCLHNTAYRSKFWNRAVGVPLGLPSFVSYSDYQNSHFKHHRLLGTPEDKEFFNYSYENLTSLRALIPHLWMVRHYQGVTADIFHSMRGKVVREQEAKRAQARKIRSEYQLMALLIIAMVALTFIFQTTIFLRLWLIPFLIAVPAHALIELPEHMGCDRSLPNVLVNTRTMRANKLFVWFVNGNNYHVEHHWMPSVPNDKFPELHKHVISRITYLDSSYGSFYAQFFRNLRVKNLHRAWKGQPEQPEPSQDSYKTA